MKKHFLSFVCSFLFAVNILAQSPNTPAPTIYIPPVINYHHISISGVSLVLPGYTETYSADFFYPGESSHLEWVVAGGTIIGSNIGPTVTVNWNFYPFNVSPIPLPGDVELDPNARGVVGIKQGTVFTNKIYQASYLFIYNIGTGAKGNPFVGCEQRPSSQKVNYLQPPSLISGVPECITPGITHYYQWKEFDVNSQSWLPISGAIGINYQPLVVSQSTQYSRLTNDINGNSNFNRSGSNVILNNFSPGTLYTDNFGVAYGQQPTIIDEMPYGGLCQSASYTNTWEVSNNYRPWEAFGNALHFPILIGGIKKNSVRIRRKVVCNSSTLYTNILEFHMQGSGPEEPLNYIKETTVFTKGIESPEEARQLPTGLKIQTAKYYDGLGRPIQALQKETGSPDVSNPSAWQDVVSYTKYDGAGRQSQGFLPYSTSSNPGLFKSDAITAQPAYYTQNFAESPAYSQVSFEPNPFNRVTNGKRAGSVWVASNGNSLDRDVNDFSDDVKIWSMSVTPGAPPQVIGVYSTGELYKTTSIDEKLKKVIEYADKSGNPILSKVEIDPTPGNNNANWLCTYNVYDDLDRLRYTITPKAVQYLETHGYVLNATTATELCFYYEYDYKDRLALKQSPQKGSLRYVYDSRDRLVLTQDENQSLGTYSSGNKQWLFTLYDDLNRSKVTGIMNSNLTRDALQAQADLLSNSNTVISVSLGSAMAAENVTVYAPVTLLGSNIQFNSIVYYDNYDYAGSKTFNSNHNIAPSSDPNVEAIAITQRTINFSTGSKLRVLDNSGKVLINTVFYDDETRVIQSISDNIKSGEDVKTNQYDFAGKSLNNSSIHTAQNTGYSNYTVLTKYGFDIIGRVILTSKKFGNAAYKDIASYSYDVFGRMKVKKLGLNPISGGAQMESLEYTYNLNGQLTGINKFYAQKEAGRYNKWNNFFGLYLGYDNKDGAFAKAELNGNITGAIWSTQGDDAQRKFDYDYDAANQLIRANFTQKNDLTGVWENTKFDFSVTGFNGKIDYDANGNITAMLHKGNIPGNNPQTIDDLRYDYTANGGYTNKLNKVTDLAATGAQNGLLSDFKDGTNGTAPDYDYDANGNLVMDENKNLKNLVGTKGVTYNYFGKVDRINIVGKGVTQFIYDAAGNKLQKIFTPVSGTAKILTYIDEYVYEGDNLQFINFEEGRLRIITKIALSYKTLSGNFDMPVPPGAPGGTIKQGVFDYFIKDNLGNTRMVITEEQQWAKGICTMEDANAATEEPQWGQVYANGTPNQNSNEVFKTRKPVPAGWTTNSFPAGKCSKLFDPGTTSNTDQIGPNAILKVMAGDEITAQAQYYFANNSSSQNSSQFLGNLITSLAGAINGSSVTSMVKNGGNINTSLSGSNGLSGFVNSMGNYGNPNAPRAYVNIIFLDEQFNYLSSAIPERVAVAGDAYHTVNLTNIKCPKNGYAYVFLSNESSEPVFFDDFTVEHNRGRLVEESHYYPYGLKIAGINSRKLGDAENGSLQNRYGYQGENAEEDDETGWEEFDLRMYDPQIGRWTSSDPYDEFPSGYVGMGNDPVNNIDPSGGSILSSITGTSNFFLNAAATTIVGAFIGGIVDIASGNSDRKGVKIGAAIGFGLALLNSIDIDWSSNVVSEVAADAPEEACGAAARSLTVPGINPVQYANYQVPTPSLTPSGGEMLIRLTSVAMVEGDHGSKFTNEELVKIAWVYINRILRDGFEAGLKGSSPYLNKNLPDGVWYRMYSNGLGGEEFPDDAEAISNVKKNPTLIARAFTLMPQILYTLVLWENPLPSNNITGQGYHGDINGKGKRMSKKSKRNYDTKIRQYIYLVWTGVIPNNNTVFVILGSDEFHEKATFIYDEAAINRYFKKNPKMKAKKAAPQYDPVKDKFIEK